jgi:hypothetical protein
MMCMYKLPGLYPARWLSTGTPCTEPHYCYFIVLFLSFFTLVYLVNIFWTALCVSKHFTVRSTLVFAHVTHKVWFDLTVSVSCWHFLHTSHLLFNICFCYKTVGRVENAMETYWTLDFYSVHENLSEEGHFVWWKHTTGGKKCICLYADFRIFANLSPIGWKQRQKRDNGSFKHGKTQQLKTRRWSL